MSDDYFIICLDDDETNPNQGDHPPKMKSMHVVSNVRNRYVRTEVTSKYFNEETHAQQATFSIVLPDTAFIAGFVMEIKGKKYEAYVKEKEEAKQDYKAAVLRGRAAAHVAVSTRDSNNFTVSANIEPQSDVTFILTYEELLIRKHGKYEIVINLHPKQFIEDLRVDVHINETRAIVNVETPAIRSGNEITTKVTKNKYTTISKDGDKVVHVNFNPTIEQQKEMVQLQDNKTEQPTDKINGISGQFVIQYDVERDPLGGEVLVNNGYFVHFFAPTDLKPIPKHVIFVLDVSGSMGGRKLEQLKEAMIVILDELNPKDYFNIVKFSSNITVLNSKFTWDEVVIPAESILPKSFEVSDKNIRSAKTVVNYITAQDCTNIYDALIVGLRMTSKGILHLNEVNNKHKPQPIVVFLTDGQPNVSESNPDKIIEMVGNRNDNKSAIFALAFGSDADAKFLKELAIQHSGFSRHIYEAADASLQLQDFYKQISSPLLTNVSFKYAEEVNDLTQHNFDILFNGSEFVVVGKVDDMVEGFVLVEATTLNGPKQFCPIITTKPNNLEEYGSLERIWAYMTIKQLLNKKYEKKECDENNSEESTIEQEQCKSAEKQALMLALKYSFVTPVTSLVVVKPDEPDIEENLIEHNEGFSDDFRSQGDLMISAMSCCSSPTVLVQRSCAAPSRSMSNAPSSSGKLKKKMITKRKGKGDFLTTIQSCFVPEPDDLPMTDGIIKLENIRITCSVEKQIASFEEQRTYHNLSGNPEDVIDNIILPDQAVITQFYIKQGGRVYSGIGIEQSKIKNEYKTAISNGFNAAFIDLQDTNKVTVNIHILEGNEVTLVLYYQKYLENKNNKYNLNINLHNETFIENMAVIVTLVEEENANITNICPNLKFQNTVIQNTHAVINKTANNFVMIEFHATDKLQEQITKALKVNDNKFSCQFIIEYDVIPNVSTIQDAQSNAAKILPFPFLLAIAQMKE